jgi:hypothetical protein
MWDSKLTQPLLQKKLTQDLVAGNPKSVIRQETGGIVLAHAALLTPAHPGMAYI